MDASDLISPRDLARLMDKPYSTLMRWLKENEDRVRDCRFAKGSHWEYSVSRLRRAGILKEEAAHVE